MTFSAVMRRAVAAVVARGDRVAQRLGAVARAVYFVRPSIDGALARRADRLRRRKIGLAGTEVDDVDALRLQLQRAVHHRQRRRHLHLVDAPRQADATAWSIDVDSHQAKRSPSVVRNAPPGRAEPAG